MTKLFYVGIYVYSEKLLKFSLLKLVKKRKDFNKNDVDIRSRNM